MADDIRQLRQPKTIRLASNKDPTTVDITKYLSEAYQGSVLITTRSSQVQIGHLIQVTKLGDLRDSLKILSNTSHRDGLMDGKLHST